MEVSLGNFPVMLREMLGRLLPNLEYLFELIMNLNTHRLTIAIHISTHLESDSGIILKLLIIDYFKESTYYNFSGGKK